jgi:calcineurin-like phosphoesterase family protein
MKFFTSDHHFWHANVIKYCDRPFTSVEQMNEMLIKNWNDIVGPDDEVYCLGDFSMAFRPVEAYTNRLNGKKYLVPGNHDFCHSYHKKSRSLENRKKWIKNYEDNGWIVLPEQTVLDISGVATVNLCHHPYRLVSAAGETYEDKYERWRPKDDGRWLLCGHVHEKWKIVDRMINVGVDQWNFKPVPITEIEKIICSSNIEQ